MDFEVVHESPCSGSPREKIQHGLKMIVNFYEQNPYCIF
jgi:hypothetical protein